MSDIRRIPFTEQYERVMRELIRDNAGSTAEDKYKGRINDSYTITIPSMIDWRHLKKEASITTIADYSTGHISATSTTTITGSSSLWTSANSNNMLLKVSGYDEIYRCTYVGATELTIDRSWIGTDIATDTDYVLYQDRYALASDFDRMTLDPNKCVYYWSGGNRIYLKFRDQDDFKYRQSYQVSDPAYYTIKWINGDPYLYVDPPDTKARTICYEYIPTLKRMTEYITGTITTLASGGTGVTGSSTDFDGFVTDTTNYDYYFRLDRDGVGSSSVWYKVASAGSDTSLTLSDAYAGTAVSAASLAFTISRVSLLPAGLDLAIVYDAAIASSTDQNNVTQISGWTALYGRIINQYTALEGKLNYGMNRVKTIYEKSGVRR